MPFFDRRAFLEYCSAAGLGGTLFPGALVAEAERQSDDEPITPETIRAAEQVAGLEFDEEEREMLVEDLNDRLGEFEAMRSVELENETPPAFVFDPCVSGAVPPDGPDRLDWAPPAAPGRPASDEDLAFAGIGTLAALLRSGDVTSVELTRLALRRLRRYDDELNAVVTLTEERAVRRARRADEALASGNARSPLHGIPYGAKDLLAVEGYETTWGAAPFKNQDLGATTAAVIERLDEAGAVLVAKLSLGALAWGDVWFGGTTKNPWNLDQGSSGSSAGPGAAVSAGLVPFAIGSETLGSIVSPSTRTGVTGHRPTFGTVSRYGAMALSWTMDKLGPMARSAEDCALVYHAICGDDPRDRSTVEAPFRYDADRDVQNSRVGVLEGAFDSDYDDAQKEADQEALGVLRSDLGLEMEPVAWPDDLPVGPLLMILNAEAATAFDRLTRSGRDDELTRQTKDAWPHVFRSARFIPAVEYLRANRIRTRLAQEAARVTQDLDAIVAPSFAGHTLALTNLTGHPAVVVPNDFRAAEDGPDGSPRRQPGSLTFVGGLYRDAGPLRLAEAYQQATGFDEERPPVGRLQIENW